MPVIDLNCDLGESFGAYTFGNDAAVLETVTSANVACGFHGGDPHGMRETCRAAAAAGVTIGAHPGYRDLAGFGRRFIDYAPQELTDEVIYQLGAVRAIARSVGGDVAYVKPHGALYNAIATHEAQAHAVVEAVVAFDASLPLLVQPGTAIARAATHAGVRVIAEAFVDRGYAADGRLVPRGAPGALLDHDAAVAQAIEIAAHGRVTAIDGSVVSLPAESLCLHGDHPSAMQLAADVRAALEARGIEIRSAV